MSQIAIKLNKDLVTAARAVADVEHRSVPKQVEYWAKVGQIAVENPDLSYAMIRDIMLGLSQAKNGELEEYRFGQSED
ncbi:MAG: hypothetical protein ISR82_03105 [Candidatus Marinimicrobia bacterium]|nr:hypothetical protein [Candidatus Neomarinimicrobiota bacterium]MBL7010190.1 hypothetical protein [Candidatus Neomarinimicrobiota bacterium]MBL7030603.1 hypothetical protein [Candidatus Neomarinimicrobiota bacterium]